MEKSSLKNRCGCKKIPAILNGVRKKLQLAFVWVDGLLYKKLAAKSMVDPSYERGLATAEYAIVTIAAAGFAGLLIVILKSGEVREMLLSIIRQALSI